MSMKQEIGLLISFSIPHESTNRVYAQFAFRWNKMNEWSRNVEIIQNSILLWPNLLHFEEGFIVFTILDRFLIIRYC